MLESALIGDTEVVETTKHVCISLFGELDSLTLKLDRPINILRITQTLEPMQARGAKASE